MTGGLALMDAPGVDGETVARWGRRALRIAFIVAGLAATVFILGHIGALVVYGLPAPFLRRIPVGAAPAA